MVKCPKCINGKMTVTVTEGQTTYESTFECIYCHGHGEISDERLAKIRAMDAMWCRCGNKSGNITYHDDAPGSKHHWTCDDCGKVVQVG